MRWQRGMVWLTVALSAELAGCAHAPGMQLDAASNEARARVDLKTLGTTLNCELDEQRRVRSNDREPSCPWPFAATTGVTSTLWRRKTSCG